MYGQSSRESFWTFIFGKNVAYLKPHEMGTNKTSGHWPTRVYECAILISCAVLDLIETKGSKSLGYALSQFPVLIYGVDIQTVSKEECLLHIS
jgi:hypothetical protein